MKVFPYKINKAGNGDASVSIRGKDTKPEMVVRRMVHAMGYRFRLHRKDVPGTPDLVFPGLGKVIFVHGCFWHSHNCRYGRVKPKTNVGFWTDKREKTKQRDSRNKRELRKLGWEVLVVWECHASRGDLSERLREFLST